MGDNTAIGHAVPVGATEVTAMTGWSSLTLLFPNSSTAPTFEEYYEGDDPFNSFPIFDFPSGDMDGYSSANAYAQHLFDNFPQVDIGHAQYATPIRVGTINCITRDNPWFGISAGKSVKLNVIAGGTGTTLGVGAFDNLEDFSVAVGDLVTGIVSAVSENPAGL